MTYIQKSTLTIIAYLNLVFRKSAFIGQAAPLEFKLIIKVD